MNYPKELWIIHSITDFFTPLMYCTLYTSLHILYVLFFLVLSWNVLKYTHFLSVLLYIFFNTVLILAGAVNGPHCFNLGVSYVCRFVCFHIKRDIFVSLNSLSKDYYSLLNASHSFEILIWPHNSLKYAFNLKFLF